MKITQKILGVVFLLFILSTLVSGGSVNLDHGTNSLVAYDDMDNLTADRTLTLNWSNNFTGYDGDGGTADVVIAIYVPVDYGVVSINNITINNNSFQRYNVSPGNCTELNTEANKTVWHTNCTLITINGTLQNPTGGFSLIINITLSDSCANTVCVNKTYELMFSDMITYKKRVNATCNSSTYNWSGNGDTYCYTTESNIKYSCAVAGNVTGNVNRSCNITKGIGNMYNTTAIMEQGTTGKLVTVPYSDFQFNLSFGWNFISLPVIPANNSISKSLLPIENRYQLVMRWNATTQEFEGYSPLDSSPPFSIFNTDKGYFIYCTDQNGAEFKITGQKQSGTQINLNYGWNAISWPHTYETKNISDALSPISDKYQLVMRWDVTAQEFEGYSPLDSSPPFSTFEPGKGYFVYITDTEGTSLTI